MSQTVEVRPHQRTRPYAAVRAQTTAKLRQEVDKQAAVFRRMERDLGRLVAFNVRQETQ